MIGEIKLKIPYPVKVWFATVNINRDIGFSFDQRAILNLLENNNIDLPGYKEWVDGKTHSFVLCETLFAAAQSYCMKRYIKPNFEKKGLIKGFGELPEEKQTEVIECWTKSETFGFKKMPGKKKAAKH